MLKIREGDTAEVSLSRLVRDGTERFCRSSGNRDIRKMELYEVLVHHLFDRPRLKIPSTLMNTSSSAIGSFVARRVNSVAFRG